MSGNSEFKREEQVSLLMEAKHCSKQIEKRFLG
jgi:hypothetical protein